MTGGRQSAERREILATIPAWNWAAERSPGPVDERDVELERALAALKRALEFRRTSNAVLRELGVSFALYSVVFTTHRLEHAKEDAVSQREVAQASGFSTSSMSRLMQALHRRGLVDIGFDQWGFEQRIVVTTAGRRLLESAKVALLQAAQELCP